MFVGMTRVPDASARQKLQSRMSKVCDSSLNMSWDSGIDDAFGLSC